MKTQKTKIEFEWDGKNYVLEYTADSLRKMEARGFDIAEIDKKLLTLGETLFCGAFIANHDDVKERIRKEIYKEISAVSDDEEAKSIEDAIIGMFQEALDELTSHRGNLKWRMAK